MTLRIKTIKAHAPIQRGYVRKYEQCVKCDRVYYRDYVPYSLSNPILVLPCGHGVGDRWEYAVRGLEEQEGKRAMLAQLK